MIKTPLSTVIGGAGIWTPEATVINGAKLSFETVMKKLFANGEQGFFYDPNDLSTMYQDDAGTIPVTGVGQPVGLIRDKSGRNNHARQTTSASRPILRQNATTGAYYLEFDGSDDFLQTSNIDFTVTDEVSLFAGVRRLADGTFGVIAEHGANTDTRGSFAVLSSSGKGYYLQCGTPGDRTLLVSSGGVSAPRSDVVASKMNRAKTDISEMLYSINSQTMSSNLVTIEGQGAIGNFANQPLYIGRRAGTSFPFNGHIYSLIGVGRLSTDNEMTAIEKELAKCTGVTLSV